MKVQKTDHDKQKLVMLLSDQCTTEEIHCKYIGGNYYLYINLLLHFLWDHNAIQRDFKKMYYGNLR